MLLKLTPGSKPKESNDPLLIEKCPDLIGQIQNKQLCSNLTFWKNKYCNFGQRCKGNWPGQCNSYQPILHAKYSEYYIGNPEKCVDKSDINFNNLTGICKKDFMFNCNINSTQCIHRDLICNGHFDCDDKSDEDPDICSKCPPKIGYPAEKLKYATFPCLHRYTNRSICAVPCDGIDDLCAEFLDENCETDPIDYTLFFIFSLITITIIVGEFVLLYEKKKE